MSYRALFTADIHVGNKLPWAVKDPATMITDRALDIMSVLDQMGEYALEAELTDIWVVGDLIDNRQVDAVTLKLVAQQLTHLQELGLKVRLVPGNHEAGDAACRHFTLDAYAAMGFWVAGQTDVVTDQISTIEPVDGFRVVTLPYLPVSRFDEMANRFDKQADRFDLALIHQTIKGGMVGGWTSPDGVEPGLLGMLAKTTLSGHFHSPQDITDKIHYLGAPVQHNFADALDKRGFWDVTWMGTGKSCVRRKIPIRDAPTFIELDWHVDQNNGPPSFERIPERAYVNLKVIGSKATVDKNWKLAEIWCGDARQSHGARLARPVAAVHTVAKQRIDLGTSEERPTWDKLLSSYLSSVDCTGLNRQTLEVLGAQLIAAADK